MHITIGNSPQDPECGSDTYGKFVSIAIATVSDLWKTELRGQQEVYIDQKGTVLVFPGSY
jgi:hypothetical protein